MYPKTWLKLLIHPEGRAETGRYRATALAVQIDLFDWHRETRPFHSKTNNHRHQRPPRGTKNQISFSTAVSCESGPRRNNKNNGDRCLWGGSIQKIKEHPLRNVLAQLCSLQLPLTPNPDELSPLSYLNGWAFFLLAALLSHTHRHRGKACAQDTQTHRHTHTGKTLTAGETGKTRDQDKDASETRWMWRWRTRWDTVRRVLAAGESRATLKVP